MSFAFCVLFVLAIPRVVFADVAYAFHMQLSRNDHVEQKVVDKRPKSREIFSDENTSIVLMYRYGLGGYSSGIIRLASEHCFAVGTSRNPDPIFLEGEKDFNLYQLQNG